jgi:hypothetical protein
MKKITLLAFLLATTLHAQQFPEPYCNITEDDYEDVEEITGITFNNESVSFTPDFTNALIDLTANTLNVQAGQSYPISIAGDTYGDYINVITVFVDWDQNGILNDENEVYVLGEIFDTDGFDGITADGIIQVPQDAMVGDTRMRILKNYHSPNNDILADIEPCAILYFYDIEEPDEDGFEPGFYTSYGQFVDLTVNVSTLSNNQFNKNTISVYPNPVKDVLTISSNYTIEEITVYNIQGQLVLESNNTNQIITSSLPIGQYLIKVKSNGLYSTNKFIKQ